MTMQVALRTALERGCYARPADQVGYAYRYVQNGKRLFLAISGATGRKQSHIVEELNPPITKGMLEDEWILCDACGEDFVEPRPGMSLKDLV